MDGVGLPDEGLAKHVWFSGRQLPPCLCKHRKVRKKDPIEENIDADDEDDATSKRPKRSVKRKHTPNHSESDEVTFQQGTLGMMFWNSIMNDQFYDGDNESDDNPDTTEETDAIPEDSEWEVSDFLSSSDSSDDWVPRI